MVKNPRSIEEKNAKDMYIANFVPFKYAKSIIVPSEYETKSTFALRSLRSCQYLEETKRDTAIGDAEEGELLGNPVMVSCWTKIKNNDHVTEEDWMELHEKGGKDKFAQTDGIVIVSTVAKIRKFLSETFPIPSLEKIDEPVDYDKPIDEHKDDDYISRVVRATFAKRNRYSYQREYRFAFVLRVGCPLEKITYYVKPEDYIDKIQFGPKMIPQKREELLFCVYGVFRNMIYPSFEEKWQKIRNSGAC